MSTSRQDGMPISSETTPLLGPEDNESSSNATGLIGRSGPAKVTPVPWLQVSVLCVARMLDGWFFFSINPYIGEMLISVGIPEAQIGFYAGLVESIYSISECFFLLYVWTDLSNRIGRKPVLLICLLGITIGGTLFGFSQNVWQMVLSRTIAGMFSGCIGMIRIIMAEITDETNRAPAFAFFSAVGYFPLLMGPVCGGALSRPAERYALFRDVALFHKFPYLLPSLLMGVFGVIIVTVTAFFVEETRTAGLRKENGYSPSSKDVLRSPGVAYTLILLCVSSGLIFAWTAVFPIFMYTSTSLGGLSLSVSQISYILAVLAVLQLLNTVIVFPILYRRKGIHGILQICGALLITICIIAPFCNLAKRVGSTTGSWICVIGTGLAAAGSTILFTTKALAVNDVSPSPQALAKVNSLSLVFTMGMRAVAPSLASSVFAAGVQYRILKGQLIWVCLGGIAVAWCIALKRFPEKAQRPAEEFQNDRRS